MVQIADTGWLELGYRSCRHACPVAVDSQSIAVDVGLGMKSAGRVESLQSLAARKFGLAVGIDCIDHFHHTGELQERHHSLAGHTDRFRTTELEELRRNLAVVAGIDVGLADSSDHDIEVDHSRPRALENRRMGIDCRDRTL